MKWQSEQRIELQVGSASIAYRHLVGNLWKVDYDWQQQRILPLLACSSPDRAAADRAASGLL